MQGNFFKYLGKEMGWLLIDRTLASFKKGTDITILQRRAEFLGRLGLLLVRSRRNLLFSNLRIALPGSSRGDIVKTAEEIVRNICRSFVDVFYHAYHTQMLPGHIRLEQNGVLEDILSNGKGCIVATGHVGTFPWLGIPFVERGVPFAPIARDPHDERLKEAFDDAKRRIGYTTIPDRPPATVIKGTLKVLRQGGGVMITFDMHPAGRGGLEVELLGRKTPMFSTVVRLAARTGVPIVPGQVLLEPDGFHHRVTYYPPIDVPREAEDETSPITRELLQKMADWLSGVIRNHPEQWWGIHRRWREDL